MFTITFAPIHSHCGLRRWNSCFLPHFSSISAFRLLRHGSFCSGVHWYGARKRWRAAPRRRLALVTSGVSTGSAGVSESSIACLNVTAQRIAIVISPLDAL